MSCTIKLGEFTEDYPAFTSMFNTYRSGAKYLTMLIVAPANISLLNDVFARFIVPLIAVG
jgi:hypothetical protein